MLVNKSASYGNVFFIDQFDLSKTDGVMGAVVRRRKSSIKNINFLDVEKYYKKTLIFNSKIGQTSFLVNENTNYPFNYNNLLYYSRLHFYYSRAVAKEEDYYKLLDIKNVKELKLFFKKCKKRNEWKRKSFRLKVMKRACELQLIQNYELRLKLLAFSGRDKIIYFNIADRFFGVGHDFNGENQLGKILMDCRDKYLKEYNKNIKAYNYKKDMSSILKDLFEFIDMNKSKLSDEVKAKYFMNDNYKSFSNLLLVDKNKIDSFDVIKASIL
jgi:predicted NAD-dependent protein-ADP-ribosyltransferase YbiA (DUF1768 family)